MIWFYERKGDHLRCELQLPAEGDRYNLVITGPDGTETVESFTDTDELTQRTVDLEQSLRSDGWDGPYSRDR